MLLLNEQNMFRSLWELRGRLLDSVIDGGETSLARVLGLFQTFSRRHRLTLETASTTLPDGSTVEVITGNGTWKPKVPAPEEHPPARMPDGTPLLSFTRIAGAETIRPFAGDYDRVGVRYLLDLVRTQRFDAIVELGSGLGERLFELYLGGGPAHIPYFGAEYWESGRRVADRLAALEPKLDFRSVPFDLSQPDFSFLDGFGRVLLFTNAAAYCVPGLPADFARRLAGAAPEVTGVHFELIHHQVTATPTADAVEEARRRGFNGDFASRMLHAQYAGEIEMIYYAPDAYMVSSAHPVTIMHWQSHRSRP